MTRGRFLKKMRGVIPAGLTAAVLLSVLCGCSEKQPEQKADVEITVICKGSQHEFWQTARMGAEDACEEQGIAMTFVAPKDESEIDAQIGMVREAIENEVDGILLAPLDVERLNPILEEAHEAGIEVLTFDSSVSSPYPKSTIGTSNKAAGAIAARNAAAMIDAGSTVGVIAHVEGAQTANERVGGFVEEMTQIMGSDVEILDTFYCDGDVERAKQGALAFMEENPNLKLIYGINEGSAVGAAKAVEEAGKTREVHVIGFDSSDDEIAYLKSGIIDGMMVQNPYNMGYLGIRNLYKVIQGEDVDEKIDTGVTYVNQENVGDEDIEWLLYPMGKPESE